MANRPADQQRRTTTGFESRAPFRPHVVALAAGIFFVIMVVSQTASAAVTAVSPAVSEKSANPVKPIMEGMHGAEARLKGGDTGADTRAIQEQVVKDLQKLIDTAKPRSNESNQQQNSSSQQESGSQNRSQTQGKQSGAEAPSGGGQAGATGNGKTPSGQPGRKPGKGKPSPSEREKKPTESVRHPMMRDVWGHLPPALRERVPSDFHETILPAYDDLVRRYFEALLSGQSAAASSSAGADQLPSAEPAPTVLPNSDPARPAQ